MKPIKYSQIPYLEQMPISLRVIQSLYGTFSVLQMLVKSAFMSAVVLCGGLLFLLVSVIYFCSCIIGLASRQPRRGLLSICKKRLIIVIFVRRGFMRYVIERHHLWQVFYNLMWPFSRMDTI